MIVFFDIGSTLIDGPPFGPARRLSETLGLGPEAVAEMERLLFRSPARDPEELANTVVNRLRVDFDRAFEACSALWNAQLQEAYVLPGAREAIAKLKAAGIPRAYLSNIWPPFYEHFKQEFAEEAGGQPQFLSFQTGLMKPDPAFFQLALRALEARAEDAVMVGDTYRNDIRPAIELGMRTVWVLHRPEKEKADLIAVMNGELPPPDLTLSSIAELEPSKLFSHANC
ncbi:MAG TPA: HAD family hydrolase [Bryobacteraceae bacterium]|jgi:HAD superfamily hydrolase (TIGR01509 family)|nr:HAD family hydrolase [Bryobacteraceae bacterium]